jgi:hypothetical protein
MTETMHIVWRDSDHYKPLDGMRVLCLLKLASGECQFALGSWDAKNREWVCIMPDKVVAWAELPEAPEWTR